MGTLLAPANGRCPACLLGHGSARTGARALDNGVLYIGSGDGFVYALDAASGMERWRARTEGWIHSSPVLLDDLVYVGSNDGALHFLDRRTGVNR